jgi:L-alanine-DL-glutamate epimerase-like enolase superfamily enzyme
MAETVVHLIGALIQAALELLAQHTGRKVLSLWGGRSNPFIELLIGLVVWSVAGLLLVAIIAALAAKP